MEGRKLHPLYNYKKTGMCYIAYNENKSLAVFGDKKCSWIRKPHYSGIEPA